MDRRDKVTWMLAAALGLVLLLCLTSNPHDRTRDMDRDEYLEELVQECIDIHTMEGNSNVAACLELRR